MERHTQPDSLTQQQRSPKLRINEIFFSLQGESTKVGLPTIFIRLTGCPLRCQYCDSAYAFCEGKKMSIDNIIKDIDRYQTKHVTVTGGEPLAQHSCHELLARLSDAGFLVSLETSGAIDIAKVDERVMKIMDIKTPASKEESKNKFENLAYINKQDQLKFVICNQADYEWAKQTINKLQLTDYCDILFSPEHGSQNPTELANWILEDSLNVRMQVQLHKYLWGNIPGK